MRDRGSFQFFRNLNSGRLSCIIKFELPELKYYVEPFPSIFKQTFTTSFIENTPDELIDILKQIKKQLDIWIKYLEGIK